MLHALVAGGKLLRHTQGGYALPEEMTDRGPAAVAAHLQRTKVALRVQQDVAASHESALVAWGLDTWGVHLDDVHVARLPGSGRPLRTRRQNHRTHALPPGAFYVVRNGMPTVDAATAICQVAAAGDLDTAVAAADIALRTKVCTREGLAERAAMWRGLAGASRVRLVPMLADARAESGGETRLRLALGRLGLLVTPQVVIGVRGRRYRVDLLADECPLIFEFDGAVKYRGENGADAVIKEKRREDDLRSLKYAVERITHADLSEPGSVQRAATRGRISCDGRTDHPGRVDLSGGGTSRTA